MGAVATLDKQTQWQDLYLRKALNDSGTVPYAGGTWTHSPDLIPYGTEAVGDPGKVFGGSNFGKDLGRPTVLGSQNYYYMRAKNLGGAGNEGTMSLYYCPQNLFLFPSLWNQNQLSTSSGKTSLQVKAAQPNDVVVGSEPFVHTTDSQIHSCLIGRMVTKQHPNPLPKDGDFPNMSDLATFIVSHPDMGWRNVVLVDATVPTFSNKFLIDTTSQAPGSSAEFLIGVSFTNLTVGSQLEFSAGTPVPSGPDQGKVIRLTKTPVHQSDGSLGTSYLTIPAGYKTEVNYSYWAKTPIKKNWTVRFFALQIVPDEHPAAPFARPVHELGAGIDATHPLLVSGGIQKAIRVGDVSCAGV